MAFSPPSPLTGQERGRIANNHEDLNSVSLHDLAGGRYRRGSPTNSGNRLLGEHPSPYISGFREELSPIQQQDTQKPGFITHETPDSKTPAQWGVNWRSPTLMLCLFLAGIGFSMGHHAYYQSLDGVVVNSESQQQWAIRIGTGLAFLTKSALAAAVGVAFMQYLWVVVGRKPMRLESIDAMFSLTTDPLSFTQPEVFLHAKLLTLLALVAWFVPLVATVTPATLSIRPIIDTNVTDVVVPYTDYQTYVESWHGYEAVGYVSGAGPPLQRLVAATSSSMAVIPITAPFPNASYTIKFFGPSLKCENLAELNSTTNKTLFNEEFTSQIDSTTTRDLAVGTLLVYNAIQPLSLHHNIFINLNGDSKGNKNISCSLWNASYTVDFDFSNGVQSTKANLDHLEQITYDRPLVPSEYPPNGEGYESMYLALSNLIVGQFGESTYDGSFIQEKTSIPITGVAACPEIANGSMWQTTGTNNWLSAPMSPWMCRNGSVERAIEDLSHNFTLSLFSSEYLSGNTTTPVRVSFPQNHYTYNAKDLLMSYLIGIFATLLCVLLGGWSYYRNGYSASASFSTILFTTRNHDLDLLASGKCLGAQPLEKTIRKTQLQYGTLSESNGMLHTAFGLRGTVRQLEKGQACY